MIASSPLRRRERGAAAVEFAIIFPLFLLLIGGIVDFGRAYFTQIALSNAAREGARAAVVGVTSAEVLARIDSAIGDNQRIGPVDVTPPAPHCPGPGTRVEVTLSVEFDWIILGPAMRVIPGGSDLVPDELSSTAEMWCG